MSSQFQTRLWLDEIESRLMPSVNPIAPARHAGTVTPYAQAKPYVFVDFAGMDNFPKDGRNDYATQLTISVTDIDGTTTQINVAVQPGQTNESVALAVASALRAQGYTVDVNGSAMTIWGQGDTAVDNVRVGITGAADVGKDNTNLKPPDVAGFNNATGSGYIALPQ